MPVLRSGVAKGTTGHRLANSPPCGHGFPGESGKPHTSRADSATCVPGSLLVSCLVRFGSNANKSLSAFLARNAVFRQLRPSCSLQIFARQNTRKRRPRRCSTPDVVGVSTQTGCQKLKHQEVPALILINQGPYRRGLEAAALGGLADSAGCHAKKKPSRTLRLSTHRTFPICKS